MAIPVLKNRLLQLTNRDFREESYGAHSFRDFLRQQSDLLRVEETPLPGIVVLRSAGIERSEAPIHKRAAPEISPDLWQAILDFSSGSKYLWDDSSQKARKAEKDESGIVLPTITADELDVWRSNFIQLHSPEDDDSRSKIDEWLKSRLPTHALPVSLRKLWNRDLTQRVRDRLNTWFAENELTAPLQVDAAVAFGSPDKQLEQLRNFVIACVGRMSRQELEELRISPVVALRMTRG